MTPKFHTLKIADVRTETEDTVSIRFEVPEILTEAYHFQAGQYLTLKSEVDGEEIRRSYSLCSAPYEHEWRVAVKQVYAGKFSTFANTKLKVGDELEVMTPMGNFKFDPKPTAKRFFALFAAGSGITPILSIAKTILKEEPNSEVDLFYGNKNVGSIIFKEEIEALKNLYMDRLRVIHVLSRENLGNPLQKGRIDREKADHLHKGFLTSLSIDGVYICGPESMILDVKDSFIANGLEVSKIHFELFTSPGRKQETPLSEPVEEISSAVKIIIDGDTFDIPLTSTGENILDAAHKAGADLPYACKGGVCCTCKAKIISGTARMDVNYGLEKDEIEAGYILTCQAHPTSENLIVSFDE